MSVQEAVPRRAVFSGENLMVILPSAVNKAAQKCPEYFMTPSRHIITELSTLTLRDSLDRSWSCGEISIPQNGDG